MNVNVHAKAYLNEEIPSPAPEPIYGELDIY